MPVVEVSFCKFANPNSRIRLIEGRLLVQITDLLEGAPDAILEALAHILISKLYQKPVPKPHADRYRRYLNRKEMRRTIHLLRQTRGRKLYAPPSGTVYNLDSIFEKLNTEHFFGLMARPLLGWSLRRSRTTLGHFDPSHNVIVISRLLDNERVPAAAVEYVMFHEMLHLRFPVDHRGARRCVHTPEFKQAEAEFPGLSEAKEMLKRLPED